MIYLDNAATTKPFESVVEKMNAFYKELYFNPSALYSPAFAVAKEKEKTRDYISSALGGGGKVYFTSCATESNTWALNNGIKNKNGNIVVSSGEHASVYENAQSLLSKGLEVRFVKLDSDGRVNIDDFVKKVDENTTLISVINCSNETGAVNDIKKLAQLAKNINRRALFHSDGVQALGKVPLNCKSAGIDMYSVSAHKICGPKGVGALWICDGLTLSPLLPGGGQESGLRSGTENVAAIIGFGEALKRFSDSDKSEILNMRETLKQRLLTLDCVEINESESQSPYILSFSAKNVKAEIMQRNLAEKGILIGLGSACSSRLKKNRVLTAMGRTMSHIEGSMRLSFSPQNHNDDMEKAAEIICNTITEYRKR